MIIFPDISHYEVSTQPNYSALADSGAMAVIYKASQGSKYKDPTMLQQRIYVKRAGLLFGTYHFGDSSDVSSQVANYLSTDPQPDEVFCLDFENYTSQMTLTQAVAFMSEVEEALGRYRRCVIYSGNTLKEKMTSVDPFMSKRRLWLAEYDSSYKLPIGFDNYWVWQYTDAQTLPGIRDTVDCNKFNGTADELKANWA